MNAPITAPATPTSLRQLFGVRRSLGEGGSGCAKARIERSEDNEVHADDAQAAIAAVHDEAARSEDTDWPQILALYGLLKRMSDNPMVMLNHAIATAMVHGSSAGLELHTTGLRPVGRRASRNGITS